MANPIPAILIRGPLLLGPTSIGNDGDALFLDGAGHVEPHPAAWRDQTNTFTAGQVIELASDDVALTIRGASDQFENLTEWRDWGGIVRSVVDHFGNVGIGTDTPEEPLHVGGRSRFEDHIFTHRGTFSGMSHRLIDGDNLFEDGWFVGVWTTSSPDFLIRSNRQNASDQNIVRVNVAAPEHSLYIDAEGRVGLGTDSPNSNATLHVAGQIRADGHSQPLVLDGAAYMDELAIRFPGESFWRVIDAQSTASIGSSGEYDWLFSVGRAYQWPDRAIRFGGYEPGGFGTNMGFIVERGNGDRLFTVTHLGSVGVGPEFDSVNTPQRSLHVKDVMRLEPRDSAPSNAEAGDLYFDSTLNKLRVHDGSDWRNLH